MKSAQCVWTQSGGWSVAPAKLDIGGVQLVFLFGSPVVLHQEKLIENVRNIFPDAILAGCSTAGEIQGEVVFDDSLCLTAVNFEKTTVRAVCAEIDEPSDIRKISSDLAKQLVDDKLVHVFVLSDGLNINGTDLVEGVGSALPENVSVSGGLAGDGPFFKKTYVLCNGKPKEKAVMLVGFYSDCLEVYCGSKGGWDSFGPKRLVTRSESNILHSLDNNSALALYKKYLGDFSKDLPASALLFPLSLSVDDSPDSELVRTILGIDEESGSMIFAGDIPEGMYVRFMMANKDRLIDGAQLAGEKCVNTGKPDLALFVSCVGRKIVLGQRVEEELEAAISSLGEDVPVTGYYSYGELSPTNSGGKCSLHNQTMTITTFTEKV